MVNAGDNHDTVNGGPAPGSNSLDGGAGDNVLTDVEHINGGPFGATIIEARRTTSSWVAMATTGWPVGGAGSDTPNRVGNLSGNDRLSGGTGTCIADSGDTVSACEE